MVHWAGQAAPENRGVPTGCTDGSPGPAKEASQVIPSMTSLRDPGLAAVARIQQDSAFTTGDSLAAVDVGDTDQELFGAASCLGPQ